jgi:hypothetical protein
MSIVRVLQYIIEEQEEYLLVRKRLENPIGISLESE